MCLNMSSMRYGQFGRGGPKWPVNWASEANIQHTTKSSSNWHVHQDWCETNEIVFRKWPKTGILTYLGDQSGPKIGPLRPKFPTHLKVLAMIRWSNTDVKPVETFLESDQTPEFWLTWSFEAHIVHISESSSNEQRKQDWCEMIQRKLFNKIYVNLNFDSFGDKKWSKKFGSPTTVAPMSLKIKFQVNPVETFQANRRKPINYPILALFVAKRGPKIWSTEAIFTHTWKYSQSWYSCKPSFMVPYQNFVWENNQKQPKYPFFTYFCN